MGKSLFEKVWDLHKIRKLPTGKDQIFIGLHLIHEVTSPQAFSMIRDCSTGTVQSASPCSNRTGGLYSDA